MKQKVSFSRESGASYLPPYEPIEVINYYVEIEHENELARRRVVTPPPPPPPDPGEELPHNTIVSLPKINKLVGCYNAHTHTRTHTHTHTHVHTHTSDLSGSLHVQVMKLAEDQISNGVRELGLVTPAGTNVNERAYHIVQVICVAVQLLTWAVRDDKGTCSLNSFLVNVPERM